MLAGLCGRCVRDKHCPVYFCLYIAECLVELTLLGAVNIETHAAIGLTLCIEVAVKGLTGYSNPSCFMEVSRRLRINTDS